MTALGDGCWMTVAGTTAAVGVPVDGARDHPLRKKLAVRRPSNIAIGITAVTACAMSHSDTAKGLT